MRKELVDCEYIAGCSDYEFEKCDDCARNKTLKGVKPSKWWPYKLKHLLKEN
jgi:hypothetical protein